MFIADWAERGVPERVVYYIRHRRTRKVLRLMDTPYLGNQAPDTLKNLKLSACRRSMWGGAMEVVRSYVWPDRCTRPEIIASYSKARVCVFAQSQQLAPQPELVYL